MGSPRPPATPKPRSGPVLNPSPQGGREIEQVRPVITPSSSVGEPEIGPWPRWGRVNQTKGGGVLLAVKPRVLNPTRQSLKEEPSGVETADPKPHMP